MSAPGIKRAVQPRVPSPHDESFARRHIGLTPEDVAAMLKALGFESLEALVSEAMPQAIRMQEELKLPPALTEAEALLHLRELASHNLVTPSFIGMGYHGTILPSVIKRNVLENPAWYTAYTPYQPEISQGRLEALLNFQTMIAELTALPLATASLLDEPTAAAEAMMVARRVSQSPSDTFLVDAHAHPQTVAVLRTRARPLGWAIAVTEFGSTKALPECFGGLIQYPGTYGHLPDLKAQIARLHDLGALSIVAADPLALTVLVPPGELGADLAVGSTQRFGVPMGFGGPHAAYMAAQSKYQRHLPGRIVGVSVDVHGNPAYRLAMQTREQHIRREKATSNICTAQALLAVIASCYALYHGPRGLTGIAKRVHRHTAVLAAGLARLNVEVLNASFFDTLTVTGRSEHEHILRRARSAELNFRLIPAGACSSSPALGISLDETTTPAIVESIWRCFGQELAYGEVETSAGLTDSDLTHIQLALRRRSPALTHPMFERFTSETELQRYLRRLADRDLALDRAMIPLGSCTMKLNAATELMPLSWPEFSQLHPYAPADQSHGYRTLCTVLERLLCEITGYDVCSLQPNSGAQGEYAGLLAIRAYHQARGESTRNVCLIPSSAHGTNPASAVLAGLTVVVVRCDSRGNIDKNHLRDLCARHRGDLAALMITYPSTHGVFEEDIRELCDAAHDAGGQVYIDGANLNAQVGLARPGDYGGDVSHLNLHKTFCIPHGGGGPGMGPIVAKAHLAPYLPSHPLSPRAAGVGPVAAAEYGSASILTISYAYIRMMGAQGLRRASETAILSANYIAARLEPYYPVLYRNTRGRVAHECIIDPRKLRDECGVTVEDIAKRLMDYGFHAPTVSFPVAGTFMIEPTESEAKAELDRFCDAMIAIRTEIRDIEEGRIPLAESPLRWAPHTAVDLLRSDWTRSYSREVGAVLHARRGISLSSPDKYWPPVGRIDQVYGDRNLFCTCPPMEGSST